MTNPIKQAYETIIQDLSNDVGWDEVVLEATLQVLRHRLYELDLWEQCTHPESRALDCAECKDNGEVCNEYVCVDCGATIE